jgi:hypothetical protein
MTFLLKAGKMKMKTKNNFIPQIYELISEPDNVEKIRNHIAFIIKGRGR